jgi:hypothetical protein
MTFLTTRSRDSAYSACAVALEPHQEGASMRAFTATAGLLFALLFLVHVLRLITEGLGPLHNPIFDLTSVASLIASVWSFYLLIGSRGKS